MIETFKASLPFLLRGIEVTIKISVVSIALGIVIGLVACLLKLSKNKVCCGIANVYIWVIRGTPMLVQALMVYFGLPQIIRPMLAYLTSCAVTSFRFTPYVAGVVTLSLNAGAYLAEIFRGGIQAVPRGQTEAARSLGLSKAKTTFRIVLPQALRISLPSIVNQFIISVKDTSILTVIGLKEIVNEATQYIQIKYDYFNTYAWVALFYLAVISCLMVLSMYIEKRMSYDRKGKGQ